MMTLRWKEYSDLSSKTYRIKASRRVVMDDVTEGVKSLIILKEQIKNFKEKGKTLNSLN